MSAKTVADKLLIKSDATLWSSHPDRIGLIGPLPGGVRTVERLDQARTALVFADDADSLRELLHRHGDQLTRPNILWVSYPKANRTDLNRDTLWPILAEYGMRPVGQVAVNEDGPRCDSGHSRRASRLLPAAAERPGTDRLGDCAPW